MCAGATVFHGLLEANLSPGHSVAIVGIGALGFLGVQFAKAMGCRVVAISSRDLTNPLSRKPSSQTSLSRPKILPRHRRSSISQTALVSMLLSSAQTTSQIMTRSCTDSDSEVLPWF